MVGVHRKRCPICKVLFGGKGSLKRHIPKCGKPRERTQRKGK